MLQGFCFYAPFSYSWTGYANIVKAVMAVTEKQD